MFSGCIPSLANEVNVKLFTTGVNLERCHKRERERAKKEEEKRKKTREIWKGEKKRRELFRKNGGLYAYGLASRNFFFSLFSTPYILSFLFLSLTIFFFAFFCSYARLVMFIFDVHV